MSSVHTEYLADGTLVYRVRWRQGGRQRSQTFNTKRMGGTRKARSAADKWRQKMAELEALGDFAVLDRGSVTLNDYWPVWWEMHAQPRLADSTLEVYATVLDKHVLSFFGEWQLREITPAALDDWMVGLAKKKVGAPTIRKAASVLQGILKRAVRDGELTNNPVAQVDKPRAPRTRKPIIVSALDVERIRAWLIAKEQHGDAMLVSLLAYAGPRPESEALPLEWPAVGKVSITLDATKKHGAYRTFKTLAPLAADLHAWRGRRGLRLTGLVLPFHKGHAATEGSAWTGDQWDRWRDRVFRKAAEEVGLPKTLRPRDLRNSFASLLIWSGHSVVDVAAQLGHTPRMCLDTYAGVFAEYDPADRRPAEDVIRDARAQVAGTLKTTKEATS